MANLSLHNVRKSFATVDVIKGVDLEVKDGEFVVFVGPSGCGKSTLLRLIAGLEQATSGDIRIDDAQMMGVPASDRGLAMVFQSYALYPHMSVYKNMAFGLENMKLPAAEIDKRVRHAGELLRLTEYLERKPKALSGGQRQRVAIGRAIVREPKIFLFDEPLSNLDAELRVTMRKELSALHADIGGTMIYVTHDQVEAMTLANRIVVLRAGKIEQVGAPLELYNTPVNTFVAGFIGSPRMNFFDGTIDSFAAGSLTVALGKATSGHANSGYAGRLTLPWHGRALAQGETVTIGIRPEHLEAVDIVSSEFSASIDLIEQLGGETYLYASNPSLGSLTLHQSGQFAGKCGDAVGIRSRPGRIHLFDAEGNRIDPATQTAN